MLRPYTFQLILNAAKGCGSFKPKDIFPEIYESLFDNEVGQVSKFLQWLHDNNRTIGHGNYEQVYTEFLNDMEYEGIIS